MQLSTLRQTLVNFAENPCASWGLTYGGSDFLAGTQARVPIEQADRNTARLRSGTYTEEQLADFDRQCANVEARGGTARFSNYLPDSLRFRQVCRDCKKPFASCKDDAVRCYDCELLVLCPALPGRQISHHWFYNDHEWTLSVHGDVGFHNELTFWWSNRYTGSNVGHQGLVVYRDTAGRIKKLVFSTIARNAVKRYRIVWDLESDTTQLLLNPTNSVNDDRAGATTALDEFDPLVLDLIFAMIPAFMLDKHRPCNPANGCYTA